MKQAVVMTGHGAGVERTERFSSVRLLLARLCQGISLSAAGIVVVTLTAMFLAIFVNVVLRYAFDSGITWAYEIHSILFPWLVAGGAVMAAAHGRSIAVEVAVNRLPETGRRIARIVVDGVIVVLAVAVVDSAIPIVRAAQYSRLANTGIPQMYGYASLLYAFGMIGVLALLDAVRLLLGERAEVADPAAGKFS